MRYWDIRDFGGSIKKVINKRSGYIVYLNVCDGEDLAIQLNMVSKLYDEDANPNEKLDFVDYVKNIINTEAGKSDSVYESFCSGCGETFITLEGVITCDECDEVCEIITKYDIDELDGDTVVLLDEGISSRHVLVTTFRDGKKIIVKRKRKKNKATLAQRKALEIARGNAHSGGARLKRRRSVMARRDASLIRDI